MAGDSEQKTVSLINLGECEYDNKTTTMGLPARACFTHTGVGKE